MTSIYHDVIARSEAYDLLITYRSDAFETDDPQFGIISAFAHLFTSPSDKNRNLGSMLKTVLLRTEVM